MTIEDDIAFLERLPILRRLGAPALRILAIGVESYTVQAGEVLFSAGEPADCAYIVQRGSFALKGRPPGENDVVAPPGILLGESALLAETERPVTAVAREDSVVLRVSRTMFLKMLESFPDAAVRIRDLIASRTEQWAREMEEIRLNLGRGPKPG